MITAAAPLEPVATGAKPSVMVVEDDMVIRLMLSTALLDAGYQVMEAEDGIAGVELYRQEQPDLILMDMMMPRMSGDEAAQLIKAEAGDRFVPILFLTAIDKEDQLAALLDAGGDDFLVKPVNPLILKAKLNALDRTRVLHGLVTDQKNDLEAHRAREWYEREVAAGIMEGVTRMEELEAPNLRHHLAPAALLNGDLLLAAHTPAGAQRIFLGDFTGHGLAASIGAMPVSEIFYSCTDRGMGVPETLRQINTRLLKLLPADVFLAAACIETDVRQVTAKVWNAGLPDLLWVRGSRLVKRFSSSHLPLGITGGEALDEGLREVPIAMDDRFYMYTDGMVELLDDGAEQFGYDRLEEALLHEPADDPVGGLLAARKRWVGDEEPTDDATLVEITCVATTASPLPDADAIEVTGETQWTASFRYEAGLLRQADPLPLWSQVFTDFHMPSAARRDAMLILRELYTNALDHGLLGLDSSLKRGINGFADYGEVRQRRLAKLEEGHVNIRLRYVGSSQGGRLRVTMRDTGGGYDWRAAEESDSEKLRWGRGLALVRSVCSSVTHNEAGNQIEVEYDW